MTKNHIRTTQEFFEAMEAAPVFMGGLLVVIGIAIAAYNYAVVYPVKSAVFGNQSVKTTAALAEAHAVTEGKTVTYLAALTFQDTNDRPHTVENSYSMKEWFALRDAQKGEVRYLKSDPDVAVALRSQQGEPPNIFSYLLYSMLFFIPGVLTILYGIRREKPIVEVEEPIRPVPVARRPPPGRPLA